MLIIVGCSKEELYLTEPALMNYLIRFVEDAEENGVDLNYVYHGKINIYFVEGTEFAGKAFSTRNDKKIHIEIKKSSWNRKGDFSKKMLMYHEFGHDILTMWHCSDARIMHAGTYNLSSKDHDDLIKELFDVYKEKKLISFCFE